MGIYFLTIVEARSLKSSCWQAVLPLKGLWENASLPLPASGGSLVGGCITPLSASVLTWPPPCVSPCVSSSARYKGTLSLIQSDLILTNYICEASISK